MIKDKQNSNQLLVKNIGIDTYGKIFCSCAMIVKYVFQRYGDRNVNISLPDVSQYRKYTPVLIDDIIAAARTMIAAVKHLWDADMRAPVCVGVHGVFSDESLLN